VAALAEGVLKAMYLTRLKIAAAVLATCLVLASSSWLALADKPADGATPAAAVAEKANAPAGFAELRQLLRPGPNELPWNKVPWMLSITEAQAKAAAEGKPILVQVSCGAGYANVFGQC
jgi:hypothetical protein